VTEYLTEQEQIQQLKNWIKQYGLTVVSGVLIAILLTTGYKYWQDYRNKVLLHASSIYDEMLTLRAQNNAAGSLVQTNKLLSHYKNTPYAQMAALALARNDVSNKDYAAAQKELNWVINHSSDKSIQEIARARIARIDLAMNQPEAALKLLNTIKDPAFAGLDDEIRGDALLQEHKPAEARAAYGKAITEIPNAEVNRPILIMKYDNLATD
jgi:predicted negative regulator of RcsB-dependent stress response